MFASLLVYTRHCIYGTSISANADGPRDAASCKIDHITLPTRVQLPRNECRSIAIATQTEKIRLLTQIRMIMLKLHLVDLLSTYYTIKFATNTLTNQTDGA